VYKYVIIKTKLQEGGIKMSDKKIGIALGGGGKEGLPT
jgi:hypothetical protein